MIMLNSLVLGIFARALGSRPLAHDCPFDDRVHGTGPRPSAVQAVGNSAGKVEQHPKTHRGERIVPGERKPAKRAGPS